MLTQICARLQNRDELEDSDDDNMLSKPAPKKPSRFAGGAAKKSGGLFDSDSD